MVEVNGLKTECYIHNFTYTLNPVIVNYQSSRSQHFDFYSLRSVSQEKEI